VTVGEGVVACLSVPGGGEAPGVGGGEAPERGAVRAAGRRLGVGFASRALGQGGDAARLALIGALIGVPGFAAIILASVFVGPALFILGTGLTGLGAGLFGHATLTATIRNAPSGQIGLSIGTRGAVQATCAGIGIALAGVVRDILVAPATGLAGSQPHLPYNVVFMIEIACLVLAIMVAIPLVTRRIWSEPGSQPRQDTVQQPNTVEVP